MTTLTSLNDLVRFAPGNRTPIATSECYSLVRTRGGWMVKGYEWHSDQDASREFDHHESRGRGDSPVEAVRAWQARAIAIGGRRENGCKGLSAAEAAAVAADLLQQAEEAEEYLAEAGSPDVSVSAEAWGEQVRYRVRVEAGPWRNTAYYDTRPEQPVAEVAEVLAAAAMRGLPACVSVTISPDDVPADGARKIHVNQVMRTGQGTLIRRSDGAEVEVLDRRDTYPSSSGGGIQTYYAVRDAAGVEHHHGWDMHRLYR